MHSPLNTAAFVAKLVSPCRACARQYHEKDECYDSCAAIKRYVKFEKTYMRWSKGAFEGNSALHHQYAVTIPAMQKGNSHGL